MGDNCKKLVEKTPASSSNFCTFLWCSVAKKQHVGCLEMGQNGNVIREKDYKPSNVLVPDFETTQLWRANKGWYALIKNSNHSHASINSKLAICFASKDSTFLQIKLSLWYCSILYLIVCCSKCFWKIYVSSFRK